ncbi:MAG: MoaD/ThiS family protein [Panacagrimonas sp.]
MKVRIEFWGVTRRLAGADRCDVVLGEGADVRALIEALHSNAELTAELGRCAFAVGTELVAADHLLSDGDQVAVLPPVSGG